MPSNNPNDTSGRANKAGGSLRYPLSEDLSDGVILRFVSYDRFSPDATATERTTATIKLPVPFGVPDRSSIRTNNFDMNSFGQITQENVDKVMGLKADINDASAAEILGIGNSFLTDMLTNHVYNNSMGALKGLALMPGYGDGRVRDVMKSFAGVVANPHTTIVFDGVNLRSYFLSWRFSPRNKDESDALKKIHQTIKERSHPEEIFNGFALNYPDLVYVDFVGSIKEYMPKFQKSFVMDVNMGQGGGQAFYKSGAPVEVELQISLSELNVATRDSLERDHGTVP